MNIVVYTAILSIISLAGLTAFFSSLKKGKEDGIFRASLGVLFFAAIGWIILAVMLIAG